MTNVVCHFLGLEVLVGIQTVFTIPTVHPSELVLFTQCASFSQEQRVWYAVALEANPSFELSSYSNTLVLYKLYVSHFIISDLVHII